MPQVAQKSLKLPASDLQAGDRVQVIDREATPEENKQRIFYNHMRGLRGVVRRVYEEEDEVWVDVDLDSLPEAVRQRHQETEEQMRRKWLDGMSEDGRRKLSPEETRIGLRYSVLVSPSHLIVTERSGRAPEPTGTAAAPAGNGSGPETAGRRKTLKDLSAAEKEFLERARTDKQPR